MRKLHASVLVFSLAFAAAAGGVNAAEEHEAKSNQGPPQKRVIHEAKHDVSQPLHKLRPVFPTPRKEAAERENKAREISAVGGVSEDPLRQITFGQAAMPGTSASFDGIANPNGYLPPDTNADVGPNHIVETVNVSFAIYDKSGTKIYPTNVPAAATNTLWSGFGGLCETTNDGDPVVQYDHLANRWLISQFAFNGNGSSGPYYECVAVSTTPDPTGSYYRYSFLISDTKFDDYPKISVWPDAYYMSVNQFVNQFVGAGAVAFERQKMLAGQAARLVYYDLNTNFYSMLPADLDGSTLPPAGAPNPFVQFDDNQWGYAQDQLEVWNFHVDWTNPANSTFTAGPVLGTAAFDSDMCGYARNCVPQQGTTVRLDSLSDRLLYRVAYRNFGDHQSMVMNHTVDATGGDLAGLRWYELRKTAGDWVVHQQGTLAPDSNNRWSGSVAMDKSGDIAIGYSASSDSLYPSIRYAGRLVTDTLGTLPQGEGVLVAGGGYQTHSSGRWGDYSSMMVDPTDDCTFWYAGEYYASPSVAGWRTRIGSFKFPSCGSGVTVPTISSFAPIVASAGATVTITGSELTGATGVTFGYVAAPYTVNSPTQITATVPTGVAFGRWRVTTRGGTATSSLIGSLPVPTLTSASAFYAGVGAAVTLTGTGFQNVTGVTLGNLPAQSYTVVSPTTITAIVPGFRDYGRWRVNTLAGPATSSVVFTVFSGTPTGLTFAPLTANAGGSVTLTGTGFDESTSAVSAGYIPAPFTRISATQITATVPAGVSYGRWRVTTSAGTSVSSLVFSVPLRIPQISSVSAYAGGAGTTVTLVGSNFTNVSDVTLGGVPTFYTVNSPTSVSARVPGGVSYGRWRVTTPDGTGASDVVFAAS